MWLGVMRRMMPNVDDLFDYIDVVAETGQTLSSGHVPEITGLTAHLLDAGITTIVMPATTRAAPGILMQH